MDYNHAKLKYLTEAVNADGAYGTISRSLLRAQAKALGGMPDSDLGPMGMRALRVRQMSAVGQSSLEMVNTSEKTQLLMQESSISQTLKTILATDEEALRYVPQRVVLPLLSMGATRIQDVLSADCKTVLSASDLRRQYGKHRFKRKQEIALYRLAYILHTDQVG